MITNTTTVFSNDRTISENKYKNYDLSNYITKCLMRFKIPEDIIKHCAPAISTSVDFCLKNSRYQDEKETIKHCTKAIAEKPKFAGKPNVSHKLLTLLFRKRMQAYSKNFDFNNALADSNIIIKREPGNSLGYQSRSYIFSQLGDHHQEVIADINKAFELTNFEEINSFGKILLLVRRGRSYLALGQKDKAIEDFKTVITLEETKKEGERYSASPFAFKMLKKIKPDLTFAKNRRDLEWSKSRCYGEYSHDHIKDCLIVINTMPKDTIEARIIITKATFSLAKIFSRRGDETKAIEYLNKFISTILPASKIEDRIIISKATFNLAKIFSRRGDKTKAIEYLNKSISTKLPASKYGIIKRAHYERGKIFVEQSEFKKAISDFSKSHPKKDSGLFHRGVAFLALRNYQEAITEFEKFNAVKKDRKKLYAANVLEDLARFYKFLKEEKIQDLSMLKSMDEVKKMDEEAKAKYVDSIFAMFLNKPKNKPYKFNMAHRSFSIYSHIKHKKSEPDVYLPSSLRKFIRAVIEERDSFFVLVNNAQFNEKNPLEKAFYLVETEKLYVKALHLLETEKLSNGYGYDPKKVLMHQWQDIARQRIKKLKALREQLIYFKIVDGKK